MDYNKISFERKSRFTQKEIDILFNIIKINMIKYVLSHKNLWDRIFIFNDDLMKTKRWRKFF